MKDEDKDISTASGIGSSLFEKVRALLSESTVCMV